MQLSHSIRFSLLLAACLITVSVDAGAQSLTGTWQVTVSEISNTCAEPLGGPEHSELGIFQAGDLIAATGSPNQTEISGVVSGSSLSIGFETSEDGGVTIYDPVENELAITAGGTRISGNLVWEFFEPLGCFGTQSWSATKMGPGTPGDLSGEWTIEVQEATESCGPPDPTVLPIPVTIQQEADLVRLTADEVTLGQTRLYGRVSGTNLQVGLGIRQGGFTVFDAAESNVVIDPGFAAFAGTTAWESFTEHTCSGVDSIVATLPEPGAPASLLAAVASLFAIRRSCRIRS